MTYEVIDNFLKKEDANNIKNIMTSNDFQWFYSKNVTNHSDKIISSKEYYFTHIFYSEFSWNSPWSQDIIQPIIQKISPKALVRIKGNFYPRTESVFKNGYHVDYDFYTNGAIYYVNTNDGCTILEDGSEIESVENRLLIFDPSKPHCSTHCTDQHGRININFNYF